MSSLKKSWPAGSSGSVQVNLGSDLWVRSQYYNDERMGNPIDGPRRCRGVTCLASMAHSMGRKESRLIFPCLCLISAAQALFPSTAHSWQTQTQSATQTQTQTLRHTDTAWYRLHNPSLSLHNSQLTNTDAVMSKDDKTWKRARHALKKSITETDVKSWWESESKKASVGESDKKFDRAPK